MSKAYSEDSRWRNRDTFVSRRAEIVAFLAGEWERELCAAIHRPRPDTEREVEIPLQ